VGQTRVTAHSCGYPLILEEVTDSVDVGHGLHLPDELRATLRCDEYAERCYLPLGILLYWYDGTLDMEDAELAQHEVKYCPKCGAALPLGKRKGVDSNERQ
jgi:hypothetical protein